jgi:hypothetical protein
VIRLLFVAALAACGSKSPEPATTATPRSTYDELEARVPKILAAMEQLAKDLTVVKEDCPKVASVLRKWGSEFAAEIESLAALKTKLSAAERERYDLEHDEDAKRIAPVFATAMTTCQGDTEVQSALGVAGFRRVEQTKP